MSEERKARVLVIDDSPTDIDLARTALPIYQVKAATTREAALGIILSDSPPDLILLDVVMPDMDGYRLCHEIRSLTKDIPIVFVTQKDSAEDEYAGFLAGAVDYISKPLNPILLAARVKTHLELKRAKVALQEQNDLLRENVRLREEVEAINRHDLKNPLMVVLEVPKVLSRQPNITPEQVKWLKMIEDAGRKMLEMINQTIDLFKMETGTYVLNAVPVDLIETMHEIHRAQLQQIQERSLGWEMKAKGHPVQEGEKFFVGAEALLLYSLLANLLKNAVEASPFGGKISIELEEDELARVRIHNAGAVPESIRGRFFEKFATAGKNGGTGLGAYSARLMARALKGTVEFQSSEEAGTTLTVLLPRPGQGSSLQTD